MAKWGYEGDEFNPETVQQAELDRRRRQNETCPATGRNAYCSRCGKAAGSSTIDGCVCPNCGCQFKALRASPAIASLPEQYLPGRRVRLILADHEFDRCTGMLREPWDLSGDNRNWKVHFDGHPFQSHWGYHISCLQLLPEEAKA